MISEQDAEQIEQDLLDWVSEEPIHKRRVDMDNFLSSDPGDFLG